MLEKGKSGKIQPGKADPAKVSPSDPSGAYRKHSTPKVTQKLAKKSFGVGGPSSLS